MPCLRSHKYRKARPTAWQQMNPGVFRYSPDGRVFCRPPGYWVDYVKGIQWRKPLRLPIMFPYVFLYLATVMFYWWPLGLLSRPLWIVFGVLFVVGTILNITSH